MEKVAALLAVLAGLLSVVVLAGYADMVVSQLRWLAEQIESLFPAEPPHRFQRVGRQLDDFIASWLAPAALLIAALLVFAWVAHERRR